MATLRQNAIKQVKDMEYSYLRELVVESHSTNSHKWVEVTPHGNVHETEEADNNTTHWIDYPNKEVASIFNINNESCEACDCDICVMYRHAKDGKEAFIEEYGHTEEEWDYIHRQSKADAIVEYELDNGGIDTDGIREQMIEAIEEIEYGYFNDEDKKRYTFALDVGYPVYETKEFATDQEALEYGKNRLHSTTATSVAVYDGHKQIGDFDCADEL